MGKFGWHYPPGAANDPNAPYNQPDRSHEHRWEEVDKNPVIEDGAAIFRDECTYAEGRRGNGWECEETRQYRFEYSTLELPDGGRIKLCDIHDWEKNGERVREVITGIEVRHCYVGPGDEETSIDVDPDPEYGVVVIEWNGWALRYEPSQ